jgi:tetratricopeptide (TPR) repeat protein
VSFRSLRLASIVALAGVLATPSLALAQSSRQVLLVVNEASPESVRIGEHYARRRGLPDDAIVRLRASTGDEIARQDYVAQLEAPISAWLSRHSAQDRIHFLVLTKGVPLRIAGTAGRNGSVASVDSELALLYRRMTGRQVPAQGFVPNPYFGGTGPVDEWTPFSHERHDIYLVTRLDGYTVEDVIGLIDRAQGAEGPLGAPSEAGVATAQARTALTTEGAAVNVAAPVAGSAPTGAPTASGRGTPAGAAVPTLPPGRIVLDMKAALDDKGNAWLKAAADRLQQMGLGDRVLLEQTSTVVRDQKDLVGYYAWGTNDPGIRERDLGNRFVPGAIAGQFVSTDGRTFKEPPADWKLGTWEQRQSFYAGSPQSLAGDLVRQGVTGVAAQVAEPFFDATIRPEILFPAYLSGFTLAEAYYLAMPYLSWQTVIVGDPLATVTSMTLGRRPAPEALEPAVDPATELPSWFSARVLGALETSGIKPEAVAAWARAQSRLGRADQDGARKALEDAIAADTRLTAALLLLGTIYDGAGDYAKAEERYRAALANEPRSVIALNNLAYLLAVRLKRPGDALPFAEKAYTLAPGNGNIADTLAWVHHLLGNKERAGRYIGDALRGEPASAEVRLHAAAILLEAGDLEGAKREYAKAVELDATVAEREEAEAVRAKLR